jgi:capsid protein
LFSGMIETWAAETVQTGFWLRPQTGNALLDTQVKEALTGWDGDGGWLAECDARGMLHFWDLLTLAEETELTDGDHAFYLDPSGNGGRGTVQIIEGDRILTPWGLPEMPGRIVNSGVEMDAYGKPTRFWIADIAPSYASCSSETGDWYPAFDPKRPDLGGVLFSCQPKRYTATRRQPWLSAAVRAHDEIDDVFVAVRIQLRNLACRATYTKIGDVDSYLRWLQMVDPAFVGVQPEESLTHSPNPGDHVYTNPGEEMGVLESDIPGNNFDPFMQLQLTQIGLPLGMCIEESCRIFQKSFSASRMAVESTRRRYQRRQKQIKRLKVMPILEFAIARMQAVGDLESYPNAKRVYVRYPGWPYMEPLKDAEASAVLIENGMASRKTLAEEGNIDHDAEVIQLLKEEVELAPIIQRQSGRPATRSTSTQAEPAGAPPA